MKVEVDQNPLPCPSHPGVVAEEEAPDGGQGGEQVDGGRLAGHPALQYAHAHAQGHCIA